MSKCLTVVALVLLVLAGAMGLRNIVASGATTPSASGLSAPAIWPHAPGEPPAAIWPHAPGEPPAAMWAHAPGEPPLAPRTPAR